MESVYRRQEKASHPLEVRGLEDELRGFKDDFLKLGLRAVPLLGWYAGRPERPLKLRIYAAVFLGAIGDPAAYHPLRVIASDPEEEPGLRSAALQSAGSLRRVVPVDRRSLLDGLLRGGSPEPVLREALSQLAEVGTDDVPGAFRAAKRFGPRPRGVELFSAEHAVGALGRSLRPGADAALFRLLRYFKAGSPVRVRVLRELSRRRRAAFGEGGYSSGHPLERRELDSLGKVLTREEGPAAVLAARLLGAARDKRADRHLRRSLRASQDPAVLAEAAVALASFGAPESIDAVRALSRGLLSDPRFAAREGRPDPRAFAVRIERAAASLERPEPLIPPLRDGGFRYEGWPGEGVPRLLWTGKREALVLLPEPRAAAGTPGVLRPGLMELSGSEVVMLSPGRALFREDRAVLDWRWFGKTGRVTRTEYDGPAERRSVELRRGEGIDILAYRAAGSCFLRVDEDVYEAECPQNDPGRFDLVEQPRAEWWVKTRGKTVEGWFLAEQEGIDFLPRQF